ncbi:MAG: hypothetical protein JWM80_1218 [Cyanobacteria bacterium RYN_339]|nr:hypothetical protein [Cyanobacteria bacterium RYN_339]
MDEVERKRPWAVFELAWLAVLPLPFLSWAAFAYIGLRAKHRPWLIAAAVYLAPVLFMFTEIGPGPNTALTDLAVGLVFLATIAATAHGFAIRHEYRERLAGFRPLDQPRRGLLRLAARRVDVNHATEEELAALPGVGMMGAEVAQRLRRERPFRSVEHFADALGLTPALLANLRHVASAGEQEGDQR